MVDLSDGQIQTYLEKNISQVEKIVHENKIKVLLANHAVLMSVVAMEVSKRTGCRFAIIPHGSAIEFALKKDKRFLDYATQAFTAAECVFVTGEEIKQRTCEVLPSVPGLKQKIKVLGLGVDTSIFGLIEKEDRAERIEDLQTLLKGVERGSQNEKKPDPGLENKLSQIDFKNDRILGFVGRLLESKGVIALVDAALEVLAKTENAQLVLVGHGPLRADLEKAIQAAGLSNRIHFLGFLNHKQLSYLLPCVDILVIPSIAPESGPLVLPEALASGCFPLGTYQAGIQAQIDEMELKLPDVPGKVFDQMKLDPNPSQLKQSIATQLSKILDRSVIHPHRKELYEYCRRANDWKEVASSLYSFF